MRDPFPGSPVLRLTGPQAGKQPTLASNGQALAQHTQTTKPRAPIAEGIEAHWGQAAHQSKAQLHLK